jgi:ArsR family transcriptional regulator
MSLLPEDLFAALANTSRLRCLLLLQAEGELCVCELTHATALSQPHVSRHLAQLRDLGLVIDRRQGQWVYYRLNPDLPDWVTGVLCQTARGAEYDATFANDITALQGMPDRPALRCA